jgi:hypothetical protein
MNRSLPLVIVLVGLPLAAAAVAPAAVNLFVTDRAPAPIYHKGWIDLGATGARIARRPGLSARRTRLRFARAHAHLSSMRIHGARLGCVPPGLSA